MRHIVIRSACIGLLVGAPAARAIEPPAATEITITRQGCLPAAISVAAGSHVFRIRNASARAVEWEILDGVMVREERENIAPGFVQKLTAHLDAGTYAMTCGLLSNPKGRLSVSPAVAEVPVRPSADDLVGPLAAYKVYVEHETADLAAATRTLTDALKTGKLAEARAAYAPARVHYERIEPVADCSTISTRAWTVGPMISRKRQPIRGSSVSTGSSSRCFTTTRPPVPKRLPIG